MSPTALPGWVVLGLVLLLLLAHSSFVAAEFALLRLRRLRQRPPTFHGPLRQRVAQRMMEHVETYLGAARLAMSLTAIGLGWLAMPAIVAGLTRVQPGMSRALNGLIATALFLLLSTLILALTSTARQRLAARPAAETPLLALLPLFVFAWAAAPVVLLLSNLIRRGLALLGLRRGEPVPSEEELRSLLAAGKTEGRAAHQREILDNVFELSHRTARQAMVPRADVAYLSTDHSLEESLARARASHHTRLPLCEGDLDHVVGLIHIKDLFRAATVPTSLQALARPIAFVPEGLALDRLLRRMRAERSHMVAVIDEYGGVRGIVTMENVIEEIVGEIQDEFDREQPELVTQGENRFRAAGTMLMADLVTALDVALEERHEEDTIGGVVLSKLGRQPRLGDRVDLGPLVAQVVEVDHNRIQALRLTRITPTAVAV